MSKRSVDKFLTIAHQLQASYSLDDNEPNPLLSEGLVNAVAMNVYLTLHYYLDELKAVYPYHSIQEAKQSHTGLPSLTTRLMFMPSDMSEAQELTQLLQEKDSWLSVLVNTINHLYNAEHKANTATSQPHLIAVSSCSENQFLTIDSVSRSQWLLDACDSLIQRQRNHLVEC